VADGFRISVDPSHVVAMFDRVGPSVEYHCRAVGQETAAAMVTRAQANVAKLTGETRDRIHWERTYDKQGVVVLGYSKESRSERRIVQRRNPSAKHAQRHREAHVDLYLEWGTKFMHKRPFFFKAAESVAGAHHSKLAARIQTVLNDLGR
jgi:hypothetical protein